MSKGGARPRSGPPPDPAALRRDRDRSVWIHLPAAGREGPAPTWPLSRPTRRELILWGSEWVRPQAIEWERLGQQLLVALYIRALVTAEKPRASSPTRRLVAQLMADLGITPDGMLRHRWVIDEAPLPQAASARSATARQSARARLQLVKPDDA